MLAPKSQLEQKRKCFRANRKYQGWRFRREPLERKVTLGFVYFWRKPKHWTFRQSHEILQSRFFCLEPPCAQKNPPKNMTSGLLVFHWACSVSVPSRKWSSQWNRFFGNVRVCFPFSGSKTRYPRSFVDEQVVFSDSSVLGWRKSLCKNQSKRIMAQNDVHFLKLVENRFIWVVSGKKQGCSGSSFQKKDKWLREKAIFSLKLHICALPWPWPCNRHDFRPPCKPVLATL